MTTQLQPVKFLVISLLLSWLTIACSQPVSQSPASPDSSSPAAQASSPETTASPTAPAAEISRVVALTSLSADIIHRLDSTKLVGISGSRLLAKNPAMKDIPRVSEGQTPPSLEKIVALKPDLVIGAAGFHDQILAKLKELGIRTLTTEVRDWQALQTLTRDLARAIQADPEPLLNAYQTFLSSKPTNAGSTLVLVSAQPILSPNKTSWAGDLLTQFQIKNLAADLQGQSPQRGYVTLSPEKVLEANPEVLILVDVGDGTVEKLKAAPFWKQLRAVANDRVYVFDYYGLVNPGSIDAIQKACQQLQQVATAKS
ncbi:MAG: ABC transporter substrate-binding protein [Cyanobacteria bacterium]|nr:ABC transporter substrate-binding protein [Cyanobacteriota bacterium]MDW8202106.1 ABC transporter substrate-binding protein [Cyanobacteriota bacterium SKYGB_h_bin112]